MQSKKDKTLHGGLSAFRSLRQGQGPAKQSVVARSQRMEQAGHVVAEEEAQRALARRKEGEEEEGEEEEEEQEGAGEATAGAGGRRRTQAPTGVEAVHAPPLLPPRSKGATSTVGSTTETRSAVVVVEVLVPINSTVSFITLLCTTPCAHLNIHNHTSATMDDRGGL